MSQHLLAANGLALGYRGLALLTDVRFALAGGEIMAVVGHNGSGKSTLVKAQLGVLPAISGRLDWPQGRPRVRTRRPGHQLSVHVRAQSRYPAVGAGDWRMNESRSE